MRFLFVVQGEGRGHLTQAISLGEMLRRHGHEVVEVLVGKCSNRELPASFVGKMPAEVKVFHSPAIDYGKNAAVLKLKESQMDTNGQMLRLEIEGREQTVRLPLAGTFQAMNALCALGLAIASGEDAEQAAAALAELKGAPGRLEFIGERRNGASVYVDYAHTPDALETVLKALRPHTEKRLHVIFGCGGDRDSSKRKTMGEVASSLCDEVVLTSDNPRNENPTDIISQIAEGVTCPLKTFVARTEAISYALNQMSEGDTVVIAGKGAETYMEIKGKKIPYSDLETVLRRGARG